MVIVYSLIWNTQLKKKCLKFILITLDGIILDRVTIDERIFNVNLLQVQLGYTNVFYKDECRITCN